MTRYQQEKFLEGSHFYRIISPSCNQDRRLAIPKKFIDNYGKELSNVAVLKVSGSKGWAVELNIDKDRVYFQNGWHSLMEYYSIYAGHVLVFRFKGYSQFDVIIFSVTASEIVFPRDNKHVSAPRRPASLREEHHYITEARPFASKHPFCSVTMRPTYVHDKFLLNLPSCLAKAFLKYDIRDVTLQISDGRTWQVSCSHIRNAVKLCKGWKDFVLENELEINDICNFELVDKKQRKVEVSILRRNRDCGNYDPCYHESVPEDDQIRTECPNRCKQNLTAPPGYKLIRPSSEGLQDMTNDRIPEEPLFSCHRGESRSGLLLNESKEARTVAAQSFTSENPFCSITMRPSYINRHSVLSLPSSFAKQYLKKGSKMVTLQVSDGRTWKVLCSLAKFNVKVSKGWRKFVIDNRLEENDTCIFELVDSNQIRIKVSIFRVTENRRQQKETSGHPDKLPRKKRKLSDDDTPKTDCQNIKKPVRNTVSFTSDKPFCMVTMRPFYLGSRLNFPTAFAKKYLKEAFRGVILRLPTGETWHAQCSASEPRKLRKGWKAFVLDNHLEEDDVCIFELRYSNHIELNVTIVRAQCDQ